MQKNSKRFKGKMGAEYNLISLAAPHYSDCEHKLGEVIKKYFSGQKGGKINILEVGCGSGFTSEIILKADRRINLTAVDSEPEMIRQAKERLGKYIKAKRAIIVKADASDFAGNCLPGSFDAFASALTIHNLNFKSRKELIGQIYNLLRPNGLFANMDRYAHDDPKIFKKWVEWQIGMYRKVFSELGKDDLVKKWVEHEDYDSRPDVIMKKKDAVADMKRVGFKNISFVYKKKTYSILTAKK
jgi:tRNA (cmo5U34)-methyltransferase